MPEPPTPTSKPAVLRLPPDFKLGAATAAHQVEGKNASSDWWLFEQKPGAIKNGDRSGDACDHYRRFREDIDLLRALHLTTYRFSVEWARVEPEPGRFDAAALDHYAAMVDACVRRGVEPCVTLHHFTLPQWLAARGGFVDPGAPAAFGRYTREVVRAIGRDVPMWVTINEPIVYLYHGYIAGVWPPGERDPRRMVLAGRGLLRAHAEACSILRATTGPGGLPPRVSIAKHVRLFDPARPESLLDRAAASVQDAIFNWSFMDSLARGRILPPFGVGEALPGEAPLWDYLGVNYYSRGRVRFSPTAPGALFGEQGTTQGAPVNDLGWEIYPEGLGRVLRDVHRRYGVPLWITENGIADASDAKRPAFLISHLGEVARAIGEGVPVRGYYHWSLLDNFEWAEGLEPRFGLYAVDYATQARTLRPSGALYGRIAETLEIPPFA
jgi:beta-glucosidase